MKDVSDWLVALAAGAVAIGTIFKIVRGVVMWANRTMIRVNEFLDDWQGDPAAGRPGFGDRLARVEGIVIGQLTHNGGSSLADQVSQIHGAVGAPDGQVTPDE
jgi:hypothetical protein